MSTPLPALKDQIKQELAIVNAQELIENSTEICFNKCLFSPYNNNNDQCIDNCLGNYLKAWNLISKTYIQRIKSANN